MCSQARCRLDWALPTYDERRDRSGRLTDWLPHDNAHRAREQDSVLIRLEDEKDVYSPPSTWDTTVTPSPMRQSVKMVESEGQP